MKYLTLLYLILFLFCQNALVANDFLEEDMVLTTNQSRSINIIKDCPDYESKCDGRIEYENGEIYEGEFSYGEPHGKGKYWWPNGSSFVGEFVDGLREGWGRQELDDGSNYEGNWSLGYMEGVGHYEFACGHEYSGTFFKDKMDGMGTLEKENGETYVGEWRKGKVDGEGTYTFLDGSRFVGIYKKGKRHGKGVITWRTGELFAATWKKDRIEKKATVKFNNGDTYVCEFKQGLPTGNSRYLFEDGKEIEGDVEYIEIMLMKEGTDMMAALEPNLGFASYALAVEYKKIEEFDLASENFKMAQIYLPNKSALADKIPHQVASLEDARNKMN